MTEPDVVVELLRALRASVEDLRTSLGSRIDDLRLSINERHAESGSLETRIARMELDLVGLKLQRVREGLREGLKTPALTSSLSVPDRLASMERRLELIESWTRGEP